jgi:cardiolipin synthase
MLRHLPNMLTTLRLLSAPMLAALLLGGYERAALGIFAFAGLSDAADGYLAKRFGFATRFGRYLDPAADKFLMLVSFVALAAVGAAPIWLVAIVILRDVNIVLAILLAHYLRLPLRIAPLPIGKACTAVQVGYVTLTLLLLAAGIEAPQLSLLAAIATAGVTVASWLSYGALWLKAVAMRYRRAV